MSNFDKLLELKKKVGWLICTTLLSTPLDSRPLTVMKKDDSDSIKTHKMNENKKILEERAIEHSMREPELVNELDKIIYRIKQAREEYSSQTSSFASNYAALALPRVECDLCGNRVQTINLLTISL
jgi:hypothetical protein